MYPTEEQIQNLFLKSSTVANLSTYRAKIEQEMSKLMLNSKDQNLQEFLNISEEIVRNTHKNRSQRKRSQLLAQPGNSNMTYPGFYESITLDDDDQFLQALEHDTSYYTEKDRAALISSIDDIWKYFDEDVKIKGKGRFKKYRKGKVATAVASLRSKYGLFPSTPRKSPSEIINSIDIQELKKNYEGSIETTVTQSPEAKKSYKSLKLKHKNKVKQMVLFFNSLINSTITESPLTPHTPEPTTPNYKGSSVNRNSSPTTLHSLEQVTPNYKGSSLKRNYPPTPHNTEPATPNYKSRAVNRNSPPNSQTPEPSSANYSCSALKINYPKSTSSNCKRSSLKANFPPTPQTPKPTSSNYKCSSFKKSSHSTPKTPEPTTPSCDNLSSLPLASTLTPKSPKTKPKMTTYKIKLHSPNGSIFFRRKPLPKASTVSALADNATVNNNQPHKDCVLSGRVISQLPVKEKVLLYNKFIEELGKQNPKLSKHTPVLTSMVKKKVKNEEVVREKQSCVKNLRANFEAKLSPDKPLPMVLPHLKTPTSKSSVDTRTSSKSKAGERILQISILADDSQEVLHTNNSLTAVFKTSPEAQKQRAQSNNESKKQDVSFTQSTNTFAKDSHKRTTSMLNSPNSTDPAMPSKKMRRFLLSFQNSHCEHIFSEWLKNKKDMSFVPTAADNKNNVLNVQPKSSSDQVLPGQELPKKLKAVVNSLESSKCEQLKVEKNKNKEMVIIKNTLEKENSLKSSVVEVELPLEDEQEEKEGTEFKPIKNSVTEDGKEMQDSKSMPNEKSFIEVGLPPEVGKEEEDGKSVATKMSLIEVKVALEEEGGKSMPTKVSFTKVGLPLKGDKEECHKSTPIEGLFIEVVLPPEDDKEEDEGAKSTPTEESDLALTSTKKNTSEDSPKELSPKSTDIHPRKKKQRRNFMLPVMRKLKISSTESESDPKVQNCTCPSTTEPCNYARKLIFNGSKTPESHNTDPLNNKNEVAALDEALLRQANSPSKVRTAYTLNMLSTPLPQFSENDFHDTGLSMSYIKDISRSCPSLLASSYYSNNSSPQGRVKLMQESFTDQGFSTCSPDIDSPVRINIQTNYLNKLTANGDNMSAFYAVSAQQRTQPGLDRFSTPKTAVINKQQTAVYPAKPAYKEDLPAQFGSERNTTTPSSLMQSSLSSEPAVQNPRNINLNVTVLATSQYWISTGDVTAAITIHYYESERLMLLNNIYAKQSLAEIIEMNFGIDDQKFCSDSSANLNQIIKQLPHKDNCSQYWFSTGNIVIPFAGPRMTNEKIQKFFNYIREFMQDTESLRFGIDGYEFSNIYQQTRKSATPINESPWTQIITSPLNTGDLDQFDLDLEGYKQSLTFSGFAPLDQILGKFATNGKIFRSPQMVKTLRHRHRHQPIKTTAV